MKVLRWLLQVGCVALVLVSNSFASDNRTTPYSELVPLTPRELHQFLAKGKQQTYDRSMRLAALYKEPAAGQEDLDAKYYRIELRIDEVAKWIYGRVTIRARALVDGFSQPVIDLYDNMDIDTVLDNGVYTTNWTHAGNLVTVNLNEAYDTDEEFELTIVYNGRPVGGGFQGFYFGSHSGVPIISTLSEPYLARTWWPCKDRPDDKADSVDLFVEVNEQFFVSSNGLLRDSVDNGSTTTYWWHEQYPITTYLVSLGITNYTHFWRWYSWGPEGVNKMPVDFYPYPEKHWDAVFAWGETVDMIEYFADTFGEYPFVEEKYGMTHFTWGGAMEHQTNTSITSGSFGFDRYLIAHELAHQWWGDYITCEDWHHIWLNEGFASYAEALYAENLGGSEDYHDYMTMMQYWYGGTVYCQNTSSVGYIFSSRVYDKGAWVLHMLRGVVGHDIFFDILRTYYNDPELAHAHANTEDFRDIAEAVSGIDLHPFFEDWVYGTYYPQYRYSWMTEPGAPGEYNVFLHIDQLQATSPQVFDMPIDIGIRRSSGGVDTLVVHNNKRGQDFMLTISDNTAPVGLQFDPRNWILDVHNQTSYTFHIINDSLRQGLRSVTYDDSVIARGGVLPHQFSLTAGPLPDGLSLDPLTGKLTGTPTELGDFAITVLVQDDGSYSETRDYVLTISERPFIPGDLDDNGVVTPPDVVWQVNYVYRNLMPLSSLNAADVNGDCAINPVDVVVLVNFVYRDFGELAPGCVE